MLSEKKGLPIDSHRDIWEFKQELTLQKLKRKDYQSILIKIEPNTLQNGLIQCMTNLVSEGYKMHVQTQLENSIDRTFKVRYHGVYGFSNIQ